jgi:hypothetical protein
MDADDDLWGGEVSVDGTAAPSDAHAEPSATMPSPIVDNPPGSLPDVVTPPPPANIPQESRPIEAVNELPFRLLETPKSRKRRLDRERAKGKRAMKSAVNVRPSTVDTPSNVATESVAKGKEKGKDKKPRLPDFSANEFIRLWHVMVSEEGKDALDRLLTGMTRQQVNQF